MALAIGDTILAADVVDKIYDTSEYTLKIDGELLNPVSDTKTIYKNVGPGHKLKVLYSKELDWAGGTNYFAIYVRRSDTDDWTFISQNTTEGTYYYSEAEGFEHMFTQYKIVLSVGIGAPALFLQSRGRITLSRMITPAIASQGEPLRVLDESFTTWLPERVSKITLALYNTGRVGYE